MYIKAMLFDGFGVFIWPLVLFSKFSRLIFCLVFYGFLV